MRLLISALILLGLNYNSLGQCLINSHVLPDNTILCGDSVFIEVNAAGYGQVIAQVDFNSGLTSGWMSSAGAVFSNPCSPGGVDGTGHFWIGDLSPSPRLIESPVFDFSNYTAGVRICFDLLYEVQTGVASMCEGPDEPDEGVYLQYSFGNGMWSTIHYFDPEGGFNPLLTSWNNWCFELPSAALVSNVSFRWFQGDDSGSGYDHWGVDNILILLNDPSYSIFWPGGYSPGPGLYDTINDSPYYFKNDTSAVLIMTNGNFTCYDTINVNVMKPALSVFAGRDTFLAQGACAVLNGFAENIRFPAAVKTIAKSEPVNAPLFSNSPAFEFDLPVSDLFIDSIDNLHIPSVCIDSLTAFGSVASIQMFLICPDGDSIMLFDLMMPTLFPQSANSLCFSDSGIGYLSDTSLSLGAYLPLQSFQNLSGCTANGVWKFKIKLVSPSISTGGVTLKGVSINFPDDALLGNFIFSWSPTTNMTNSSTLIPTVCPTGPNEQYILTVLDDYGCAAASDTVNIYADDYSLVWPGDADDDLVANNFDLLPIGLYYGSSGYSRDSISNRWVGHNSLNWDDSLLNGYLLKQADCNGDGVVDDADTLAIHLNYGQTHQRSDGSEAGAAEPVLKLQSDKSSYLPGEPVVIDILVADSSNQAIDLYGLAFKIVFDNTVIEPGSVAMIFNNSFLGMVADMLKLRMIFEPNSYADGAITRKDYIGADGYGKIGELRFRTAEGINTLVTTNVAVSGYKAIDAGGNPISLDAQGADFQINGLSNAVNNIRLSEWSFNVFPNPFNHKAIIQYTLGEASYCRLRVSDVIGRVLMETPLQLEQPGIHETSFFNPRVSSGLLLFEFYTDGNRIVKKAIVSE